MDNEDIKVEIGLKQKLMFDVEDWPFNSDHFFFKRGFEHFFKGYNKHNKNDVNLVFRYVDKDLNAIGASSFRSDYLNAEIITFNFRTIPLLKTYYFTLIKKYLIDRNYQLLYLIEDLEDDFVSVEFEFDENHRQINYHKVYDSDYSKSFANFMTFLSIQFLFNHEVAHSLNGHTRFLGSKKYTEYLKQSNTTHKDALKTLEMDADAYAAASLANYLNNFDYNDLIEVFPCLSMYKKKDLIDLCIFAMMSTFLCSNEYIKSKDNYLSPRTRAILCVDVLINEFKSLNAGKTNILEYYDTVIIAHENFSKIYKREGLNFDIIKQLIIEDIEYREVLRSIWSSGLREALLEFSYEDLAQ